MTASALSPPQGTDFRGHTSITLRHGWRSPKNADFLGSDPMSVLQGSLGIRTK